jgi:uncharacterized protein YcfL
MKKIIVLFLSLLILGCATSRKIPVVQMGDNNLSCDQLKAEMVRLDQTQEDINYKKGVTGTNVAAALFWIPGLIYTYYDAGEASKLINERKSHITGIYNTKNCYK